MLVRFLVCSVALSCSSGPVYPGQPADCESAHKRMVQLSCPGAVGSPGPDERYGTADDVSFVEACVDIEKVDGASLNPGCIANATSCAAVDACAEGPVQ